MQRRMLAPLLFALVALSAPTGARAQPPSAEASAQDRSFAAAAARGGMAEVSDANLALQKSKNPRVIAFARRMLRDHSAANDRLAAILQKAGIAAPTSVGVPDMAMHAKLGTLTGAAFNSAYLAAQRTAHQQTIALFRREIAQGSNAPLIAFARLTLPTLQSHLAMLSGG